MKKKMTRLVSDLDSLKSFMDDNDEIGNDRTFYQKFENVITSIDDVSKKEYDKSIADIQKIDISNFCETSEEEIEIEIDEFNDIEKRIEKFKETLYPVSTDNHHENSYSSFVNTIFFAIRFNVEQKTDLAELKELVGNNIFIQLYQGKLNIILDYQKFNNQCDEVNRLLAKHGYFLRVFGLKNKFRHLALKNSKKDIVRQLSSCIKEKYNGFHVISIECSKKLRKKFKPIDVIYMPVKSPEKKFSATTLKIYQNHTKILAETPKIYCMGLSLSVIIVESFLQDLKYKKENCSGVPGITTTNI